MLVGRCKDAVRGRVEVLEIEWEWGEADWGRLE